jgi:ABC-type transport system substrate-binding protein
MMPPIARIDGTAALLHCRSEAAAVRAIASGSQQRTIKAISHLASINQWAAREPMGQMLKAIENELAAVDDRAFRWVLKKPYPKMLLALGKISRPCCFVMPARIAATDPFKQINEYVGSGPMRLMRNEWVPGAKAVFEKFTDYVPRQEPASWLAGGKADRFRQHRIVTIADPATASAALQAGEVDWWGDAAPRPRADAAKKSQCDGGDQRPAGHSRHALFQSSAPAIQ